MRGERPPAVRFVARTRFPFLAATIRAKLCPCHFEGITVEEAAEFRDALPRNPSGKVMKRALQ
ncbi:MAG: hypothetical protein HY318_16245 [Armatimonadetes bacterium]|nr:hypothetical protein [Armatimonadota bacterium]